MKQGGTGGGDDTGAQGSLSYVHYPEGGGGLMVYTVGPNFSNCTPETRAAPDVSSRNKAVRRKT